MRLMRARQRIRGRSHSNPRNLGALAPSARRPRPLPQQGGHRVLAGGVVPRSQVGGLFRFSFIPCVQLQRRRQVGSSPRLRWDACSIRSWTRFSAACGHQQRIPQGQPCVARCGTMCCRLCSCHLCHVCWHARHGGSQAVRRQRDLEHAVFSENAEAVAVDRACGRK